MGLLKKASKQNQNTGALGQADLYKLYRLMRMRSLLRVDIKGESQHIQAMLLEVNSEKGYLVIDRPFPDNDLDTEWLGQSILFEHEQGTLVQRFHCVLQQVFEEDGDHYWRLSLPAQVTERQRRDLFRIKLSDQQQAIEVTGLESHQVLSVLDLSAEGVRVILDGNLVDSVYAGSYFQNMCLKLKGCDPIWCHFDVSHCHYMAAGGVGHEPATIAGGRLQGLSMREKQLIERFILAVQCRQRREVLADEVVPDSKAGTVAA